MTPLRKRMLLVNVKNDDSIVSFEVEDDYREPNWCPNGFFQDQFLSGWEKDTLRVVSSFASPSKVLIDVGAWIGPITLYGSKLYDRVVSFEPDPVALVHLKRNLGLPRHDGKPQGYNVTLFEKGLTSVTSSKGQLFGGSKDLGNSETTFLVGYDFFRKEASDPTQRGSYEDRTSNLITVPTITLEDSLLAAKVDPGDIGLIKIDIEGGEHFLVPAIKSFLKANKVPLLISLHYCFLPKTYVWSILESLYEIYTIVKDIHTDVQVDYQQAKENNLTDLLFVE